MNWTHTNKYNHFKYALVHGVVYFLSPHSGKATSSIYTAERFQYAIDDGIMIPIRKPVSPAERVRRVLKTLAERKDIAAYFRKIGLKAVTGRCDKCLVAVFVQKRSGCDNVRIGSESWWFDGAPFEERHLHSQIQDFISRFDGNAYPDLVCPLPISA